MAQKAYARTAAYDAAISNWLARETGEAAPAVARLRRQPAPFMRYGENPHQTAAFYAGPEAASGVATARQVQGKELSYNNVNDTDAASNWSPNSIPTRSPAVAIIKHANPCGVAAGADFARSLREGARLRSGLGFRRHRRGQSARSTPTRRAKSSRFSPR